MAPRRGLASQSFTMELLEQFYLRRNNVIEPLVLGITIGLIFITLTGLFFAAYRQYKRGDQLGL
jgi:cytochrome b6-f complex subunit 5